MYLYTTCNHILSTAHFHTCVPRHVLHLSTTFPKFVCCFMLSVSLSISMFTKQFHDCVDSTAVVHCSWTMWWQSGMSEDPTFPLPPSLSTAMMSLVRTSPSHLVLSLTCVHTHALTHSRHTCTHACSLFLSLSLSLSLSLRLLVAE